MILDLGAILTLIALKLVVFFFFYSNMAQFKEER